MAFGKQTLAVLGTTLIILSASNAFANCEPGKYPPTLVNSFTESCADQPGYKPFCDCVIDQLQKKIPLYDFIEISSKADDTLEKDERFVSSTQSCLSKVPAEKKEKE